MYLDVLGKMEFVLDSTKPTSVTQIDRNRISRHTLYRIEEHQPPVQEVCFAAKKYMCMHELYRYLQIYEYYKNMHYKTNNNNYIY